MKKIPAKIKNSYVATNGTAVRTLNVHVLEDTHIRAGQVISLSPRDLESISIMNRPEASLPYVDK